MHVHRNNNLSVTAIVSIPFETKVETFEKSLTDLQGRLDSAFANASPIALLPKGQEILSGSGLKKYIDDKKNELLVQCKSNNAMTAQYDIQESVFNFFTTFDFGDFDSKQYQVMFRTNRILKPTAKNHSSDRFTDHQLALVAAFYEKKLPPCPFLLA